VNSELNKVYLCQKQAVWPPGSANTVCPRPPLTLTLKLVCEYHLKWEPVSNLGTLSLLVLELFAMYATDGQTDRRTDIRTDKSNAAYCLVTLSHINRRGSVFLRHSVVIRCRPVSILYRYWHIQRRILAWPWNVHCGSFKVIDKSSATAEDGRPYESS